MREKMSFLLAIVLWQLVEDTLVGVFLSSRSSCGIVVSRDV